MNDDWFEPRPAPVLYDVVPPKRPSRPGAFAAVALLLVGTALAGTVFLWGGGQLPQWGAAGTEPQLAVDDALEPVSETRTTSAEIAAENAAETTTMTPPSALVLRPGEEANGIDVPMRAFAEPSEQGNADDDMPRPTSPSMPAAPAPVPTLDRSYDVKPKTNARTTDESPTTDDTPAQPWAGTAPTPPSTPTATPTEEVPSPSPPPVNPKTNDDPGF